MFRITRNWKTFSGTLVSLSGWVGLAQRPKQVDDAALKTEVSGDEWISHSVN
jgi:hypothetical protein